MVRSFGAIVLFTLVGTVSGDEPQWGHIKGQVRWAGETIPERKLVDVNVDRKECLAKGPLLSEDLVIDRKSRGVRWVMVWLVDAKDPNAKLPVHPERKKFPEKVRVDITCCTFAPHTLGVREGQTVEFRNQSRIPHNPLVVGGQRNPHVGTILPSGKSIEFAGWNQSRIPVLVTCTIHHWMKMHIRVFDHPYFAVTDEQGNFEIRNAPAGEYRLVVWHETNGWVVGDKRGMPIRIEPGKTTEFPVMMQAKP
jgi:plastocyanin